MKIHATAGKVCSSDKQVGQEQQEERSGKRNGAAEGSQEQHERDNHPHHEVDPECASELARRGVRRQSAGCGPVHDAVREPVAAEKGEG